VHSKIASMAFADEIEVPLGWREVSPDLSSSQSLDGSGDYESRSGSSRGTTSDFDGSNRTKVAAAAAASGITYDFEFSGMGKAHITSLESHTRYSP
jgi:hypothetical protein